MMAGLDGNSYAELLGCAELSRVSGRTVLYWEDQPASGVYFLITGSVELFSKSGSRKVSLWVLEPPVVLSIAPVFGMSSCPFSVRTLEDSEFVMLPCEEVRRLAMRDPAFATRAAEELATRYVESIQRLRTQFLKYGVERVADFLLDEWERQGRKATFRLPIEKHTLASTLGLANESLSRLFAMLRRWGIAVIAPFLIGSGMFLFGNGTHGGPVTSRRAARIRLRDRIDRSAAMRQDCLPVGRAQSVAPGCRAASFVEPNSSPG